MNNPPEPACSMLTAISRASALLTGRGLRDGTEFIAEKSRRTWYERAALHSYAAGDALALVHAI